MANFSTPSAGRGSRFKHFYDKKSFSNRPDVYIGKMIATCFGTGGFHKIKYQKNKEVLADKMEGCSLMIKRRKASTTVLMTTLGNFLWNWRTSQDQVAEEQANP